MWTRRRFVKMVGLATSGLMAAVGCRALPSQQQEEPTAEIVERQETSPTPQPAEDADLGQPAEPGAHKLLQPSDVIKYVMPLVVPPAMPSLDPNGTRYRIAVRQFEQQILPDNYPSTTVWGYGSDEHPDSFHYPSFTIEARHGIPTEVEWVNGLVDEGGHFLRHLLHIDQTLHWANPGGGAHGRDKGTHEQEPYGGPVPIVTHLHGGHMPEESDGHPQAWYLPDATDIPGGYASTGTFFDRFVREHDLDWQPGSATYTYPNDQAAATLWYHDHTLGMTRLNVYAGPAGFYLVRGGPGDLDPGVLPGPAPAVGDDPFGTHYEIPLAIQDRSFTSDGALYYPARRADYDGYEGPYVPHSEVHPVWVPDFYGNMMVVNGRTWPYLEVEQRRYRLRLLNGCNARFLVLRMSNDMSFWQIGSDGGFLSNPVERDQVVLGPGERADVIVDFAEAPVGSEIVLLNVGPDGPYRGLNPDGTLNGGGGSTLEPADPESTGQVMQFRVVSATDVDGTTPPEELVLPPLEELEGEDHRRSVTLTDRMDAEGRHTASLLGTETEGPLMWDDPVTENPAVGATEVWEIYNDTGEAHPVHLHLVQFRVLEREAYYGGNGPRPPEPGETGYKDTVIAYPAEITRIIARFTTPGHYVWHCHMLEHEDNEMMRPLVVG